jgi:predicted AAA+ superfamily ATPase
MKFTRTGNQPYVLAGGTFKHNHDLSTAVLDPLILKELDSIDHSTAKAAQIRRNLLQKFGKDISYAQIAYEINKRRNKLKAEL